MVGSVNTLWGLVHVRLYMYIYMNRESMKSNWPPSLHSYSAPCTGGMGKSATVFYGRLADKIATKRKQ